MQHPQERVGQTPVAAVEALLLVYREALYLLVHAQIEQHEEYMRIKRACKATWRCVVILVVCTIVWVFGVGWQ